MFSKLFSFISSGTTPYFLSIIGVLIIGFTLYFFWAQASLASNTKKIAAYQMTISAYEKTLAQYGSDIKKIKNVNTELSKIERDSAESLDSLSTRLREFEGVVKQSKGNKDKTEAVKTTVNDNTKLRLRCLELATGAAPRKNEKNAICPHILK
jgi:multidrug resistance efflux pump